MSGVARLGDLSGGHGEYKPRPIIAGSSDCFINGIPIARVGDALAIHCDNDNDCHTCNQSTGSSTVSVNGRPVARISDATGCGDSLITGSSNVFSN